ncbi:MAG: RAMP superfamily CRISPR-associated protein [Saprospiraceae bacterium]
MKVKLTTISSLLCSTGESSAHIDADIRFDQYGLPYIPGKTFKGLLRECASEVCELSGFSDEKTNLILNNLFGQSGSNEIVRPIYNNLQLLDYRDVCNDIKNLNGKLHYRDVQNYFTVFRRQTRIGENGTASGKSLRTYRLLKMGFQFEGIIENTHYFSGKEELKVLSRALLQLRYMGLRRNRGFGKVQIVYKTLPIQLNGVKFDVNSFQRISGKFKLSFCLRNLSSLQFSKPIGDQNTVGTEDFIPAQNIRGLVASLLAKNVNGELHRSELFQNIILNGNTKYISGFPIVKNIYTSIAPLALGYDKHKKVEERKVFNMLEDSKVANKPYKGWFFKTLENGLEVYNRFNTETVFSFHASRQTSDERVAGRSSEKVGGIYYYEAIEKDQKFHASIYGSHENLEIIQFLFEQSQGMHRMGHSKSAQYAVIKISNCRIEEINLPSNIIKIQKGSQFYLVFQSPVIIHNQFGMAIADGDLLESEFQKMGFELVIKDMRSAVCWVENYIQIWNCKTPREQAFGMGTTLKVEALNDVEFENGKLYLGERLNEGYGTLQYYSELPHGLKVNTANIQNIGSEPSKIVKSSIVNNILASKKKILQDEKIKLKACDAAIKVDNTKISNHLIARLRFKLDACGHDVVLWQHFIDHIEGKNAGKALGKVIGDLNLIKNLIVPEVDSIEDRILYWKSWLGMLRIKSRKPKSKENVQSNS